MLKQYQSKYVYAGDIPAAFRRLCVETMPVYHQTEQHLPAAFRRLCVETLLIFTPKRLKDPAAFRRLCVETVKPSSLRSTIQPAAFRRLCVETTPSVRQARRWPIQPPSGGCVLKLKYCLPCDRNGSPAAFRRLCVETGFSDTVYSSSMSSRLQAAVC